MDYFRALERGPAGRASRFKDSSSHLPFAMKDPPNTGEEVRATSMIVER